MHPDMLSAVYLVKEKSGKIYQ